MGFWEDLKDAFKTKAQRDEERAEEMRKALEAEKEVTKIFRKKERQLQAQAISMNQEMSNIFKCGQTANNFIGLT